MGLKEYQRKRNFRSTPEPEESVRAKGQGRMFVVQLHHASHRHYDFRLELDGVLKSWAVPKGPSMDPTVKRLAMEVEDHPLSYARFEGDIPKGNYGAGHVDVFDFGTWQALGNARQGLKNGELKFDLFGKILRGSWVLVRTRKQGSKQQWLLIKHQDGFAGEREADDFVDKKTDRPVTHKANTPGKSNAAERTTQSSVTIDSQRRTTSSANNGSSETLRADTAFAPELCRSTASPPTGDDWLHEIKWDGYRLLATVVDRRVALWSRNGIPWTHKLPQVVAAIGKLRLESAQLDGELVVLRDDRADFNALQGRLSGENDDALVYVLFDLPHLNGKSLRDVPLLERKKRLAGLLSKKPQPGLLYSEHQIGHGEQALQQATRGGLEGIVSKRIASVYRARRNGDWTKSKTRPSDEFAVIGYTEPKGSRSGIGALLLGRGSEHGLEYVGRVGTGFSSAQLVELRKQLSAARTKAPVADISRLPRKDMAAAIWVKSRLVAEVFYQGIGGHGLLRQVAFKTFRNDKRVSDLRGAGKQPDGPPLPDKTAARRTAGMNQAIVITHPEREVFPGTGITKGDVAAYYRAASAWLLPEVVGRPLSVVRCPGGVGETCFFQKHMGTGWGSHIDPVAIEEKNGPADYLRIHDEAGLLELVQMNVFEIHTWGAKAATPERADRIVFDLDPHPSVKWARVISAAGELKKQLESIGLTSFVRTSGGKGLHIVVPLKPAASWDRVKPFANAVASAMAALHPTQFVDVAGEKNRQGKIFIDWLRNSHGATSIASYSLRARADAGVAMPLFWEELKRTGGGNAFTLAKALRRLKNLKEDPWADLHDIPQALPKLPKAANTSRG